MATKNGGFALTGFRSVSYRSGTVYNWFTKRLYDQNKKFSMISNLIGKHKTVLDLPCGTGFLARHLHPSVDYTGWDLNRRFLNKVKIDSRRGKIKPNKITLKQKNIFDFNDYPIEKMDFIVFCDILHHIYPKHSELVEKAKDHAERIIICEPIAVKPDEITAHDRFGRFFVTLSRFFPERLLRFVDFMLADNDGINSYENRSSWKHDENSIKELYRSFGINEIYNLDDDYIGIWKS